MFWVMFVSSKNLFSRLVSYSPRNGHNPEENFFTELFAYVLETEPLIFEKFMKLISVTYLTDNYSIKTQYRFSKKENKNQNEYFDMPDIVIKDKKDEPIVIIENKIGSPFDTKQINRYISYIKNDQDAKVISITRDYPETLDKNNKFQHIYWYEIYKIIKNILSDSKQKLKNKFLVEEVKKFMFVKKLNGFDGFDDDLKKWTPSFEKKANDYLKQLYASLKNNQYKLTQGDKRKKNDDESYRARWINKTIWVGLWNKDFEVKNKFKIYCAIISFKNQEKIINKCKNYKLFYYPPFGKCVINYKSLSSIVKSSNKDKQIEILNDFFFSGLKDINRNKIFENNI